jgi:subtilisin family serine protease
MYPASYGLPHIVSVAASDHHDEYASSTWCEQNGSPEWRCLFTSWGAESVDLAAPGADVLSIVPDDRYMPLDGTSMATPHVAGVAGLVKSQHPDYSATDIKNAIMNSVDRPAGLETLERFRGGPAPGSFTRTNGRLNALNALEADTSEATEPIVGTLEGANWINPQQAGEHRLAGGPPGCLQEASRQGPLPGQARGPGG